MKCRPKVPFSVWDIRTVKVKFLNRERCYIDTRFKHFTTFGSFLRFFLESMNRINVYLLNTLPSGFGAVAFSWGVAFWPEFSKSPIVAWICSKGTDSRPKACVNVTSSMEFRFCSSVLLDGENDDMFFFEFFSSWKFLLWARQKTDWCLTLSVNVFLRVT